MCLEFGYSGVEKSIPEEGQRVKKDAFVRHSLYELSAHDRQGRVRAGHIAHVDIECGDAVGCDHEQCLLIDLIKISDLASAKQFEAEVTFQADKFPGWTIFWYAALRQMTAVRR